MVRLIEDKRVDGFPSVMWEQDVPTGESVHQVEQWLTLKIVAVIMIFVFTAVYAGGGGFLGGLIAALLVGGLFTGGDRAFRGGIKVWDVHVPGPPDPSPASIQREQRARAAAVLTKEYGKAMVWPAPETRELRFYILSGPDPQHISKSSASVPLAAIQSFELGTAEEWFGDLAQAQLRRIEQAPNSWVIVAPTLGEGVLLIAESGGAKAAITALHGLLTKRFVVEAAELQEKWKERLEQEEREARQQASQEERDRSGAGQPKAG
jgi:hypothetical protein